VLRHNLKRTNSNLEHMLQPIVSILDFVKVSSLLQFLNTCLNVREALPKNMNYQKHKDS